MRSRTSALLSLVLLAGSTSLFAQTSSSTKTQNSAVVPAGDLSEASITSASTPAPVDADAAAASRPLQPGQKVSAASGTSGNDSAYGLIPATTGTLGAFTLESGALLQRGGWSSSAYLNKFTRMPGSVSFLNVGLNFAYGVRDWLNIYGEFQPYVHSHVGLPGELSLRTPTGNPPYPPSIYRQVLPNRPAYVEDFPFAANNDGGVGTVTVGVKLGIASEAHGAPVSFSVRNDFIFPTRSQFNALLDNGTQSGEFNDRVVFALSKTWGNAFAWTNNFGFLAVKNPKTEGVELLKQADQVLIGTGFIIFPNRRFEIMNEYNGTLFTGSATSNTTFGPRDPIDGIWGVRFYPIPNMAIDAGYRYMLNLSNANDRNGFVFKVGFAREPVKATPVNHSPVVACMVDKPSVFAGSNDVFNINATASDPDGDSIMYRWTATGGSVDGTGAQVRWLSNGVAPGSYTVTVAVDDGHGATTTCSVNPVVNARPNRAPTVSVNSDRSSVFPGERVHFTATASDPDSDPLSYMWTTNGGKISGTDSGADLDTTGLAPGMYTATVRVEDGRGGAADASKAVTVNMPPPPPQAERINGCDFKRVNIVRVDNVCKRILDDVSLRLQNAPKATVVVIGYADPKERKSAKVATDRAENTAKYITDKGIDRSRIVTRTGTGQTGAGQQNRRIDVIFVPEGATY